MFGRDFRPFIIEQRTVSWHWHCVGILVPCLEPMPILSDSQPQERREDGSRREELRILTSSIPPLTLISLQSAETRTGSYLTVTSVISDPVPGSAME